MRLQAYLGEGSDMMINATVDECADLIVKECKPFLKEFGKAPIWRGTKRAPHYDDVYGIQTARTDRRPKDTDQDVSDFMDTYFKKKYGWKWRSEGVFTSTYTNVDSYGERCLFFPVGNYKYLFHPEIADTNDITTTMDNIELYQSKDKLDKTKPYDKDGMKFAEYMFHYLDNYHDSGLGRMIQGNNHKILEVVWKVDKFILVNHFHTDRIYRKIAERLK